MYRSIYYSPSAFHCSSTIIHRREHTERNSAMSASFPRNQFLIRRAADQVPYRTKDILSRTVHRNVELQVHESAVSCKNVSSVSYRSFFADVLTTMALSAFVTLLCHVIDDFDGNLTLPDVSASPTLTRTVTTSASDSSFQDQPTPGNK